MNAVPTLGGRGDCWVCVQPRSGAGGQVGNNPALHLVLLATQLLLLLDNALQKVHLFPSKAAPCYPPCPSDIRRQKIGEWFVADTETVQRCCLVQSLLW